MNLAIDTSTGIVSLALVQDKECLAELTWRSGQEHTTQLLPALSSLLDRVKGDIRSVTAVIVARGPGSFNGLRVGISTAKGLAFSLGVPLAGVSTLEAEAYQHAASGLPVCPVYNAGRGEIAAAVYQRRGQEWIELVPEHLTTLDELCNQIVTETVFCGELAAGSSAELRERLGEKAVIPPQAALVRRALFLAELGARRLAAGQADDPATLQPIYLRRPNITQPRQPYRTAAGGNE